MKAFLVEMLKNNAQNAYPKGSGLAWAFSAFKKLSFVLKMHALYFKSSACLIKITKEILFTFFKHKNQTFWLFSCF